MGNSRTTFIPDRLSVLIGLAPEERDLIVRVAKGEVRERDTDGGDAALEAARASDCVPL